MMDTAINHVKIVTGETVFLGSVGIMNGKISMISEEALEAKTVIEGNGFYLFPGIVDNHVHFNDPGFEWREDYAHGTRAAAIGGVTTIVDMPMQNEPAVSNADIYERKERKVHSKAYIDYSFWGALVDYNLKDLKGLREVGVKAYKSFLSPVGKDYTSLRSGHIRDALKMVKSVDGLAGFHCEDYEIIAYEHKKALSEGRDTMLDYLRSRPVIAELLATRNVIDLAKEQEARIHICHVSHDDVVRIIREAKASHIKVTAETCPHYLIYSEEDVLANDFHFKCSPPIREKSNVDRLWLAIKDGVLDCIISDHSPASSEEKSDDLGAFKAWGGISGIQTGLQIIFNEGVHNRALSPTFIARTMAENPAKIFGFGDRKGKIAIGYDADFVLFDPNKAWEITPESLFYLNKQSAFCNQKGKGLAVLTMLRGKVIAKEGQIVAQEIRGELIRC